MTAETAQTNLDELLGPEPVVDETAEQPEQVETPVEEVAEPETTVAENTTPEKPDPEEIVKSYKAMAHQERMERKQLQEQMAVMQQRFEQMLQVAQPPQAPEPEYEDDPLGATHAKINKVAGAVDEMRQAEAVRQQQAQFNQYVESVKSVERAFMEKTPDYTEAVAYVQGRRLNELRTMGYDDDTAMKVVAQDVFALTQRAQQLGQSPAELVYNLAKQTGFAPKQVQKSNIEQIAAGQQVAKSVAGGGNPVAEGSLPPNLAEMNDEDFEKLFKQFAKK